VTLATVSRELIPYIPQTELKRSIEALPGTPARIKEWEGGVLFIDLVGFTPLSVSLGAHEAAGLEALQSIMSDFFTGIIDLIHDHGGVVYQFAGDSILVAFAMRPREEWDELASRLASAAWRIMQKIHAAPAAQAFDRSFYLTIRAGASLGRYRSVLLGSADYWLIPVIVGDPVEEAVGIESFTAGAELLLGKSFLPYLPDARLEIISESNGQYYRLLELRRQSGDRFRGQDFDPAAGQKAARYLLLPALYEKVVSGAGSFLGAFREITCVFVHFQSKVHDDFDCIQACYLEVQRLSLKYGGNLVQTDMSDKGVMLLVLFGAPAAQEKKERMAARFSLELQPLLEAQPLGRMQCGITTGFAYCGDLGASVRKGYTVLGEIANIAARFSRMGKGSGVFADNRTVRRVQQEFFCKTLELIQLKGFEQPHQVYQIERPVEQIVGYIPYGQDTVTLRASELLELNSILDQAGEGSGQICMITGTAGSGKSRLLESFLFSLDGSKVQALSARCHFAERNTPLHPWKEVLQLLFGMYPGQSKSEQSAAIVESFAHLEAEAAVWMPFFMRLFSIEMPDHELVAGVDQASRKQQIFRIVAVLLEERAREKTVLLLFDDMQWMDDISFELLEFMAARIKNSAVLLLLSGRPERDLWALRKRWHFNLIELGPLEEEKARSFLRGRLALSTPDELLEGQILALARGNPYYLDAIVRNLKESGQLRERAHGFELSGPIDHLSLPGTLQEIILARLDRLSEELQMTLKAAAVLGSRITQQGLLPVLPQGIDLGGALRELALREFLSIADGMHEFVNPVVRDTIYNSILLGTRSDLHRQLAEAMEREASEYYQNTAEFLSYHYDLANVREKALKYHLMAALQTKGQLAFGETIHHLNRAVELAFDDATRHQIRMELAEAFRRQGQGDSAAELYETLLAAEIRRERRMELTLGLALTRRDQGRIEECAVLLERSIRQAGLKIAGRLPAAFAFLERLKMRFHPEDLDFDEIVIHRLAREMLGLLIRLYQFTDYRHWIYCVYVNSYRSQIAGLPENRIAERWLQCLRVLRGEDFQAQATAIFEPERRITEAVVDAQTRLASGDPDIRDFIGSRPALDPWDRLEARLVLAQGLLHRGHPGQAEEECNRVMREAMKANASFHTRRATALYSWCQYLSGSTELESIKQVLSRMNREAEMQADWMSMALCRSFLSTITFRQGLTEQSLLHAGAVWKAWSGHPLLTLEMQTAIACALDVQVRAGGFLTRSRVRFRLSRLRAPRGSLLNLVKKRQLATLNDEPVVWKELVLIEHRFVRERALLFVSAGKALGRLDFLEEGQALLRKHGLKSDLSFLER